MGRLLGTLGTIGTIESAILLFDVGRVGCAADAATVPMPGITRVAVLSAPWGRSSSGWLPGSTLGTPLPLFVGSLTARPSSKGSKKFLNHDPPEEENPQKGETTKPREREGTSDGGVRQLPRAAMEVSVQ
jgi:hypothetical protein